MPKQPIEPDDEEEVEEEEEIEDDGPAPSEIAETRSESVGEPIDSLARRNEETHLPLNFRCAFCKAKFPKMAHAVAHEKTCPEKGKPPPGPPTCKHCKKECRTVEGHAAHELRCDRRPDAPTARHPAVGAVPAATAMTFTPKGSTARHPAVVVPIATIVSAPAPFEEPDPIGVELPGPKPAEAIAMPPIDAGPPVLGRIVPIPGTQVVATLQAPKGRRITWASGYTDQQISDAMAVHITVDLAARALGLSGRTLRRRLAAMRGEDPKPRTFPVPGSPEALVLAKKVQDAEKERAKARNADLRRGHVPFVEKLRQAREAEIAIPGGEGDETYEAPTFACEHGGCEGRFRTLEVKNLHADQCLYRPRGSPESPAPTCHHCDKPFAATAKRDQHAANCPKRPSMLLERAMDGVDNEVRIERMVEAGAQKVLETLLEIYPQEIRRRCLIIALVRLK